MSLPSTGLTLGELALELGAFGVALEGDPNVSVLDVDQDSRSVGPGALFVARDGAKARGIGFARDAVRRGAVAVMVERGAVVPELGCPLLRVADVPRALAFAAEAVHGQPSRALRLAGVTGTNGKTSVSWLVQRLLEDQGLRAGRLGTLGFEFAGRQDESHLTTPEADVVSRTLAQVRRLGGTHAVMEVSSVALSSGRVEALRFDAAAFTNLTHDHLDVHGTFEAYRDAKARLFRELAPEIAVIQVDDAFGAWLRDHARARVVTVGASRDCDLSSALVALRADGLDGKLLVFGREYEFRTPWVGRHNADNILVALGVVHGLGGDVARAVEALASVEPVPGRLERCDTPEDGVRVLVDYAHTPDALSRVLVGLRSFSAGRLICVFGCGGDRDPGKRVPMGRIVGQHADLAIVTNDNPRGEDPQQIAEAIERGLREAGATYESCLDRARAIERAVSLARPGDVVLIAGKGHETYQLMGTESLPFDDRVQARAALERRRQALRAGR